MATSMIVCNPNDELVDKFAGIARLFLAQGDSWFSIGALPPEFTSNILLNVSLDQSSAVVSCAYPGKTLQEMVKWEVETPFASLLYGGQAWPWEALLLSAGGNDIIAAVNTLPTETNATKAALRLLRTPNERAGVPVASDCSHYVRPDGWAALQNTLLACFAAIVQKRDGTGSQSTGVPILVHSYDYAQPRNAPATWNMPNIGFGPWLSAAFSAYDIPNADWLTLVKYLMNSWTTFIAGSSPADDVNAKLLNSPFNIANANIHLVHLTGTLTPASIDSTELDGDWVNEIHPSIPGYIKLGPVYSTQLPAAPATLAVAATG
ncbi:hypothetical protein AB4Y36_22210 [Paraburkholderia sp. BR10936]|uniref:hypothetical protein n=1 Tax=Paraburkholderia sp. BR10936 TaxID=3236993 RepID=UPI0034D29406